MTAFNTELVGGNVPPALPLFPDFIEPIENVPFGQGLVIDNFAGGGGASTGIKRAIGRDPDVAINHSPQAIAMHKANHPNTKHYCQNIYQVDPVEVVREAGGGPVDLCWFSPDCRHFSPAKGGAPVSKSVRDLATVVIPWVERVRPRLVILENVWAFTSWSPLDENNKPIKEKEGETFRWWVQQIRNAGYKVEWRLLNANDYGAPTKRQRLFLIARCDGRPIVWPNKTHGKTGSGLAQRKTAADCIDWTIPGKSIFDRKKPLAENTLKRIAKGIQKFVIDNDKPFLLEGNAEGIAPFIGRLCQNGSGHDRGKAVEEPLTTITTKNEHLLVSAHIIKHNTGATGSKLDEPLHTIVAGSFKKRPGGGVTQGIVTTHIMKMRGNNTGHKVDEPLQTISAGGTHFAKVDTHMVKKAERVGSFLLKYYGTNTGSPIDEPIHTVTTKDRFAVIEVLGEEYVIIDIRMRMLQPRELFRAQGFEDSYIIDPVYNGRKLPKYAQVSCCGNSVSPNNAHAVVAANFEPQPEYALLAAE